MIFFGFGFLMSFLRRYGYSAIGYTLLISAIVVQVAIPVRGFFFTLADQAPWDTLELGIPALLDGLFCAGAVMISFGAILGKVSPTQLLIIAVVEPIFYFGNFALIINYLKAVDVGGGMTIHTFGAYFGLSMTWFLTTQETRSHKDNTSCYSADLFSLAGTIFLWMMWPSFNAAVASTQIGAVRAMVNTFLSLCSCVFSSFIVSRILAGGKFDVVHIQNSTLAGGVTMGVAADLNLTPAGAMGAGFSAGIISVLGYYYLTPLLSRKFNIQDVCGINNLHGMPGILSGIIGVFATLHHSYAGWTEPSLPHGHKQAGYQMAALAITFGTAVVGGLLSGLLMVLVGQLRRIISKDFFNDRTFWNLPSDYDLVVNKDSNESEMVDLP